MYYLEALILGHLLIASPTSSKEIVAGCLRPSTKLGRCKFSHALCFFAVHFVDKPIQIGIRIFYSDSSS